jgi:predicted N-acetyltransferase YhbS
MHIRAERPSDAAAIRAVTIAAFESSPYGHNGEAGIVDALRADGALTLSLVVLEGDKVLGHAAFSPVTAFSPVEGWVGLGPLSVAPDAQRRGLGAGLVRAGLERLRAAGAAGCVVLGDPAYYGRFGFESDPAMTFAGDPSPYFQRLVLHGSPPIGEVRYHPAFGA